MRTSASRHVATPPRADPGADTARRSVAVPRAAGASRFRAGLRLPALLAYTALSLPPVAVRRALAPERAAELSAHAARRWARGLCRILGIRVRAEGPRPPDGVLLVANHRSYVDVVALLTQLPCSFLAKSELASWPVIGPAAALGGTVFVRRDDTSSRRGARDAVAARLDSGVSMVVFPEGTTTAGPSLLPFRPGIFRVSAAARVPVVPVAIEVERPGDAWIGQDTFVGHFLRVFARPEVRVHLEFGPVLEGTDPEALRDAAWSWIRQRLAAHTRRAAKEAS